MRQTRTSTLQIFPRNKQQAMIFQQKSVLYSRDTSESEQDCCPKIGDDDTSASHTNITPSTSKIDIFPPNDSNSTQVPLDDLNTNQSPTTSVKSKTTLPDMNHKFKLQYKKKQSKTDGDQFYLIDYSDEHDNKTSVISDNNDYSDSFDIASLSDSDLSFVSSLLSPSSASSVSSASSASAVSSPLLLSPLRIDERNIHDNDTSIIQPLDSSPPMNIDTNKHVDIPAYIDTSVETEDKKHVILNTNIIEEIVSHMKQIPLESQRHQQHQQNQQHQSQAQIELRLRRQYEEELDILRKIYGQESEKCQEELKEEIEKIFSTQNIDKQHQQTQNIIVEIQKGLQRTQEELQQTREELQQTQEEQGKLHVRLQLLQDEVEDERKSRTTSTQQCEESQQPQKSPQCQQCQHHLQELEVQQHLTKQYQKDIEYYKSIPSSKNNENYISKVKFRQIQEELEKERQIKLQLKEELRQEHEKLVEERQRAKIYSLELIVAKQKQNNLGIIQVYPSQKQQKQQQQQKQYTKDQNHLKQAQLDLINTQSRIEQVQKDLQRLLQENLDRSFGR